MQVFRIKKPLNSEVTRYLRATADLGIIWLLFFKSAQLITTLFMIIIFFYILTMSLVNIACQFNNITQDTLERSNRITLKTNQKKFCRSNLTFHFFRLIQFLVTNLFHHMVAFCIVENAHSRTFLKGESFKLIISISDFQWSSV